MSIYSYFLYLDVIILSKNKVKYSIFIKNNFKFKSGITEINSHDDSLQNLIIINKKGTYIKPHYPINRKKNYYQHNEVLIVIDGKILVKIYDKNRNFLDQYTMIKNDIIIFLNGYHSVEFLKKSKLFETKPGPYNKNIDIPFRFDA